VKSNASVQMDMAYNIYIDACAKCTADVSDLRDLETIRSRVEDEGTSFLTITLPNFCRDFEKSLEVGFIDPTCFRSFRKYGSIPHFLRGMIGLIFDRETGRIYDESSSAYHSDSSTIVDSVRQICLAFKKIELECTPERVNIALQNFVSIEHDFSKFSIPEADLNEFSLVSAVLWDNVISTLRIADAVPRHGPGNTADKRSGNQKFVWLRWHERLEPYFPLIDSAYPISSYGSKELKMVTLVSPEEEQPVKVTPVPKTLKGPRIIAIEPACMQYAQQAIRSLLYGALESSDLTRGHVNFRDQSVNQKLALMSSKTGRLATIDLSDASDRVPWSLAMVMFRSNPDLSDSIDACRSTKAILPNGAVIGPLRKFASMGSALCFPVESMYFYTICVAALLRAHDLPVTLRNTFKVSRGVHIYGDDIVVPSIYAEVVLNYLQKYNCKVNNSKTFVSGNFRESCGVDAYKGELVTPVYLRQTQPENKQQVQKLLSWVSTANLFYKKGYWKTSSYMFARVEKILGPLPYVSEKSSALGRVTFRGGRSIERWGRRYQRFEVRAWVPRPVYRSDRIDGYAALMKTLLSLESTGRESLNSLHDSFTVSDVLHLERSALYGAVALKRRWVPAT
jgi:hypothetical protein